MNPEIKPAEASALGARLANARKEAKKTQDEAARFIGVARTTITAIEKGERRIQPMELIRLAGFYGQRVSNLLKRSSARAPLAMQLRAALAPNDPAMQALDNDAWIFQRLCEDYVELERILGSPLQRHYPTTRSIAGVPSEQAAEDLANSERQRLGLGDGPLLHLRDALEHEVGIRIFYLVLPGEVAGMFSFEEEVGACIAINARHPSQRKRLSLAHEYAHFLTSRHESSVDFSNRYQRVPDKERFANAFAPAFLMPRNGLSRRFNDTKAANKGRVTYADLLTLAHYYGTSLQSLTKRLEQLRLMSRGTWERISESGFKPEEARTLLQLDENPDSADLLPTRYLLLAAQAYRSEQITLSQFADFLRVDVSEAKRLLSTHLGTQALAHLPVVSDNMIDRQATRVK